MLPNISHELNKALSVLQATDNQTDNSQSILQFVASRCICFSTDDKYTRAPFLYDRSHLNFRRLPSLLVAFHAKESARGLAKKLAFAARTSCSEGNCFIRKKYSARPCTNRLHAKAHATLLPGARKSLLAAEVNFTSCALLSKFSFRAADKFCRGGSQIFLQLRGRARIPPRRWKIHEREANATRYSREINSGLISIFSFFPLSIYLSVFPLDFVGNLQLASSGCNDATCPGSMEILNRVAALQCSYRESSNELFHGQFDNPEEGRRILVLLSFS